MYRNEGELAMEKIIAWFEAYQIDHKVSYANGVPASVSPLGNLKVSKVGNYWAVNGRRVSRKFGQDLAAYFGG